MNDILFNLGLIYFFSGSCIITICWDCSITEMVKVVLLGIKMGKKKEYREILDFEGIVYSKKMYEIKNVVVIKILLKIRVCFPWFRPILYTKIP